MWWNWSNIGKILRMLVVLIPLAFVLTGCGSEDAPVNASGKTDEQLAEEHTKGEISWVDKEGKERQGGCWQDKILTTLYEAMGTMAMGLYSDITKGALALEMVGFGIWFMLRLMRFVSSITPENSGEVWNEVFKKIFICLFCGILASSTSGTLYVLNTFIFPLYNAFLEFGAEILNTVGQEFFDPNSNGKIMVLNAELKVAKPVLCFPASGANEATLEGFPEGPLRMMNCMICALNERLSVGNYISFRILRGGTFSMIIVGLILLVVFMIIKLSFVFYLVDNVFKFAVIVVMVPILILFYPFQKKWAIFGVKTILSSAAFMMGISIMIAVAMKALLEIIIQNPTLFNPCEGKGAEEATESGSGVFLALLLLAFMVISTIKIAKEVSAAIVDVKISDAFQQKLLGLALMIAGWFTGGAASALGKVAWVQKMNERYQKTWVAKMARKKAEIDKQLNKWAGRE